MDARVSPCSSPRLQTYNVKGLWLTGFSTSSEIALPPSDHSHPFRLLPEAVHSFAGLWAIWSWDAAGEIAFLLEPRGNDGRKFAVYFATGPSGAL